MRKDNSKVNEWCKHTRNAGGYGRRGVNKRVRLHTKEEIRKEQEDPEGVNPRGEKSPDAE